MTPKALYPIGTQLITRRLSQVARYVELFPDSSTEFASFFDPDDEVDERHLVGFCLSADEWRVTVTAENQKWLSPVPMVEDLAEAYFEIEQNGSTDYFTNIGWYQSGGVVTIGADIEDEAYTPTEIIRIVERTYPNGQRAPMLEWNEVILPTNGEQR